MRHWPYGMLCVAAMYCSGYGGSPTHIFCRRIMQNVFWPGKSIQGLSQRTNNRNEQNPATAKIATLCQQFDANVSVDYRAGSRVYIAYYAYASDYNGDYSVLVGTDQASISAQIPLQTVQLPVGNYLKFTATGQVPQVVIATWQTIWAYFADPACPHRRAYAVDFEFYKSATELEIYIGLA